MPSEGPAIAREVEADSVHAAWFAVQDWIPAQWLNRARAKTVGDRCLIVVEEQGAVDPVLAVVVAEVRDGGTRKS
jgi:hypothetical protein